MRYSIVTQDGFQSVIFEDENENVFGIPMIPGNRHYEEYLEWVAEGGEPEVIDLAVPEPTE